MKKTALLMLCAGAGLSAQSSAQAYNPSGYQGGNAYAPQAPAASDSAIFEVLARVEQLQSEVQQLRGMVEEQAHTIADLERKQANMYSDLDERMQMLSSMNAAQQPSAAPPKAVATTPAVAQPESQAPVAPAKPAAAPEAENKVAEPATPSAPQAGEKERYQEAYETLRNGRNAQAIQLFEALQRDFPAGEFGDNTQYWLGEAYKINRDYEKAKVAFNRVVSQYPNSSKVPDSLLKLGYIEFDQQNPAKARDYLTRVTTSYPGTTAAHLAAKKLAQLPQ